jgi:hypothetical protein
VRRAAAALLVAAARAVAWLLNLPPEDDNGAGDWP